MQSKLLLFLYHDFMNNMRYSLETSLMFCFRDADLMFLSLLEFEKNSKDSDIDPMKGQQRFFSSIVSKCPPEATNLMKSYYSSIRDVKSIMSLNLRAQKQVEAGSFMAKHALMQSVEQDRITMLKVSLYLILSTFNR